MTSRFIFTVEITSVLLPSVAWFPSTTHAPMVTMRWLSCWSDTGRQWTWQICGSSRHFTRLQPKGNTRSANCFSKWGGGVVIWTLLSASSCTSTMCLIRSIKKKLQWFLSARGGPHQEEQRWQHSFGHGERRRHRHPGLAAGGRCPAGRCQKGLSGQSAETLLPRKHQLQRRSGAQLHTSPPGRYRQLCVSS